MLERLVGMQAQVPRAPYAGLWSRVEGFDPHHLEELYERREVVRIGVMRATLHLLTSEDALRIRPVTQAVLDRTERGRPDMRRALDGVDFDAVRAVARELLRERPRSTADLRELLGERFPGVDPEALARGVHFAEPVLQPPPRGMWTKTGRTTWVHVEDWLGAPVATSTEPDELILRYLAAFGPATVGDIAAWSGLTRVREATDRLRPRLTTVTDDAGRELLDVPDAPFPAPDAQVPVRFLGEYDNVLVAWQDRSRVIPVEHRDVVVRALGRPMVLVDGFVRAMWRADGGTLTVTPLEMLTRDEKREVREEGKRLLALLAPTAKKLAVVL